MVVMLGAILVGMPSAVTHSRVRSHRELFLIVVGLVMAVGSVAMVMIGRAIVVVTIRIMVMLIGGATASARKSKGTSGH